MNSGPTKKDRQKAICEIIVRDAVGSQQELCDMLIARGITVTQATVSRDIAELGIVKVPRGDRNSYVLPDDLAPPPRRVSDERLRRILEDIPVSVGRSGLILLITGSPGTASVIAQAIDDSNLTEQEGTLAGDNTLLVLFADATRLERWLERFEELRGASGPPTAAAESEVTVVG